MRITLREINEENRAVCEALRVTPEQECYIASNAASLRTAEENPEVARAFLICADEQAVGFTMFAFDEENDDPDDKYWLWRFMIDQDMQGQGFGKAALKEIIRYFKDRGADVITLSTKETNTAALALYHQAGFAENGEMNDEEIVLKLRL